MRTCLGFLLAVPLLAWQAPPRFEITFPASLRSQAVDGRVLLILSKSEAREPRFGINDGLDSNQIFGIDADGLRPGQAAVIDERTLGYPRESLADVPAGDYYVQALINVYETFHRADGHVVKLPMDEGEGQQWSIKPGNLYSTPQRVHVAPGGAVRIALDHVIPPIEPPRDTKYIRHVRIESKLLSKFWGRPMYVGAIVLLPEGFDEHPEARYPVMYNQGHFPRTFGGFRTEPPAPDMTGPARVAAEYAYKFYQDWTSGRLPHMLIVLTQHANPYYDDSYAVNSANVGPYGDALTQELYPYVEKKFRAIGEPWARILYGGSTGGWEALAQQVFYPDFYNGAWCNCPDPVDFHAYQMVNLYDDRNAYLSIGPWKSVPVPAHRAADATVVSMMEDANRMELVLGTRGRSAEQFDIWQAVYSPVGEDGYPQPIYDKRTGAIDHKVAEYWREHYDLTDILRRNWATLGPKLVGKIHVKVGDADSYYLERAVRLLQQFLESTKLPGKGPYYAGDFEYGPGAPHCYSGDPSVPVSISSRTLNQRLMPQVLDWMLKTAPPGADVKSWRY